MTQQPRSADGSELKVPQDSPPEVSASSGGMLGPPGPDVRGGRRLQPPCVLNEERPNPVRLLIIAPLMSASAGFPRPLVLPEAEVRLGFFKPVTPV